MDGMGLAKAKKNVPAQKKISSSHLLCSRFDGVARNLGHFTGHVLGSGWHTGQGRVYPYEYTNKNRLLHMKANPARPKQILYSLPIIRCPLYKTFPIGHRLLIRLFVGRYALGHVPSNSVNWGITITHTYPLYTTISRIFGVISH